MINDDDDPAWVRWPTIGLAALSCGWMLTDGVRAMITGEYARMDGELGPWTGVVETVGIDPNGTAMKIGFVAYGCLQLAAAGGYLAHRRWGRPAVAVAAAGSLWYLVLGTASGVIQLALLGAGRAARPDSRSLHRD